MSANSAFISRLGRRVLGISAFLAVLTAAGCTKTPPAAPTTPNLGGAVVPETPFTPNEVGAEYEIVVSNAAGAAPTTGSVTVTDPDTNFTITSITGGNGSLWVCVLATLSCTRSDSLAPGASYDHIIVTGIVGPGAGCCRHSSHHHGRRLDGHRKRPRLHPDRYAARHDQGL